MKFAAIGLAVFLSQVNAIEEVERRFNEFVVTHGKSYATKEEYLFRLENFKAADEFIIEHNSQNRSYTVGHNMFSDMTDAERRSYQGKISIPSNIEHVEQEFDEENIELYASVDWRNRALGPIRQQGSCNSCWTFSGIGIIEAAHYFKTGQVVDLSEQQIVDCEPSYHGCNGGFERSAIAYGQSHGICYESQYPYTDSAGSCQHSSCDTGIGISYITDV